MQADQPSKFVMARNVVMPVASRMLLPGILPNGKQIRSEGLVILPFSFPLSRSEDWAALTSVFPGSMTLTWCYIEECDESKATDRHFCEPLGGVTNGTADDLLNISATMSMLHHAIISEDDRFYYFTEGDLVAFILVPQDLVLGTVFVDVWARFAWRWVDQSKEESRFAERFLEAIYQ